MSLTESAKPAELNTFLKKENKVRETVMEVGKVGMALWVLVCLLPISSSVEYPLFNHRDIVRRGTFQVGYVAVIVGQTIV